MHNAYPNPHIFIDEDIDTPRKRTAGPRPRSWEAAELAKWRARVHLTQERAVSGCSFKGDRLSPKTKMQEGRGKGTGAKKG